MASHRNGYSKLPNLNGWKAVRPLHSGGYRVHHRVRFVIASALAAVLVFLGTIVAATWLDFDGAIKVNTITYIGTKTELVDPNAGKAISFLLLGQDTRSGEENKALGYDPTGELADEHMSDTAMVVQISADRSYINLVSIPRDSMVDVPSCVTSKGSIPARTYVQFNSIFASGWQQGGDLSSAASCALTAVNALTGLKMENFIVVDFAGLKNMIDAVDGVDMCIPVDTWDGITGVNLKKGYQHLDGATATQYARMRKGTATDGSDVMRTTRQQYLIKQLINEARKKNLFTQTDDLYQLAKAALSSLNISTGLASANTLAGLAMSLKNIAAANLYMRTIPVTSDPKDSNRVVWSDDADQVWGKLRNNLPLTDQSPEDTKASSSADSSSSPSTSASEPAASGTTSGTGGSTTASPTVDPTTGLITQADGTLVDPNTGGIVNPTDGTIRDASTGQYIGIADRYLNATVCAVPAQD